VGAELGAELRSHAQRQAPACTTPRPYRPVEASHSSGESDRKQPQLRCRLDGSDERSAYRQAPPQSLPQAPPQASYRQPPGGRSSGFSLTDGSDERSAYWQAPPQSLPQDYSRQSAGGRSSGFSLTDGLCRAPRLRLKRHLSRRALCVGCSHRAKTSGLHPTASHRILVSAEDEARLPPRRRCDEGRIADGRNAASGDAAVHGDRRVRRRLRPLGRIEASVAAASTVEGGAIGEIRCAGRHPSSMAMVVAGAVAAPANREGRVAAWWRQGGTVA